MRIVDLSTAIDVEYWEPEAVIHEIMDHAAGARHMSSEMERHFGLEIEPGELMDGEFLSNDILTLTSHTGTHIDAPAHYGSKAAYGTPRTVDQLPLDWFYGPGVVLDLTAAPVGAVGADYLHTEFARIDHQPEPGEIVLLHTGADVHCGKPEYFTEFTGLDGSAVSLLLDAGVRVIGTDAFSLDAPFDNIIRRFAETRDHSVLWPAHLMGRQREYCQIERLANLQELPAHGFDVICFPVKIARAGAGWTRAVAVIR